MNILQGIKANKAEKNKFIIKPKLSAKENRQDPPLQHTNATDADVLQFIEHMIAKSMRLKELIEKRGIYNEDTFYQKHLYNSACLRTIVKQILDKMISDRRLGKNLKGMNKSNLNQIENGIWGIVERQANLYHNDLDYTRQKEQLQADLKKRKDELLLEIERLGSLDRSNRDNVLLTENVNHLQ